MVDSNSRYRKEMFVRMKLIFLGIVMFLSSTAQSADYGTEDEASAMLERAINLIKHDKDRALDAFTDLEGGFGIKDLYVFCWTKKGVMVAHPHILGMDISGYMPDGFNLFAEASDIESGEIKKLTYQYPRNRASGSEEMFTKHSLVTKVKGLFCGVGYYEK